MRYFMLALCIIRAVSALNSDNVQDKVTNALVLETSLQLESLEEEYYNTCDDKEAANCTYSDVTYRVKKLFMESKDQATKAVYESVLESGAICLSPDESKCFPDVGCFYKNRGPLKHLCRLPEDNADEQMQLYREGQDEHVVISPGNVSLIDGSTKLVALAAGWRNTNLTDFIVMKDKLMAVGYRQVLLVNYSKTVDTLDYIQSMVNAQYVGRRLGLLLQNAMNRTDLKPKNTYLVGFSMGCQVVHFAGKWVIDKLGPESKIERITALDPGAPLTDGYPGSQVSSQDAIFVDVIHTSAGYRRLQLVPSFLFQRLGFTQPLGHVDFYPNGGAYQRHCGPLDHYGCRHSFVKVYYLNSFADCDYKSTRCRSLDVFKRQNYCNATDRSDTSRMGFFADKQNGRGVQVLTAGRETPFC
ncbi:Pancreatic lipase-related protein 2 [Halotydeus destructor]|nr:Pancreatic lipase-related protein 2 [Halotydeus destructor]